MTAPLEIVLVGLDREQLQSILLTLATRRPELIDVIAAEALALGSPLTAVSAMSRSAPTPTSPPPPPDAGSIRRQVRVAFSLAGSSGRYGSVYTLESEMDSLLKQVGPYLEAGDGRSALALLEPLTEEFMARWSDIVGEWDIEDVVFFDNVGALWTEAIQCADLTAAERRSWEQRLRHWQEEDEVESYSEVGFGEAIDALKR